MVLNIRFLRRLGVEPQPPTPRASVLILVNLFQASSFSSQPSTSTHAVCIGVWGRRNGRSQKVKRKMPQDVSFSTFPPESPPVVFPIPHRRPFISIPVKNKQALNSSITRLQRFQMKPLLKKHISFPKTLLSRGGEWVGLCGFASLKRTVGRRSSHWAASLGFHFSLSSPATVPPALTSYGLVREQPKHPFPLTTPFPLAETTARHPNSFP